MDLNYLLLRRQVSIMKARTASCRASRAAHSALAAGYAARIDGMQASSGATFPLARPNDSWVSRPRAIPAIGRPSRRIHDLN